MAGFTAVSFKTKLEKLSESQQSIQTLSHWVQYHKKAVKESATIWAKEVLRAIPERRLLYIYLANDIMQNSRRKGSEFVQEYGAQMQLVMPDSYVAMPEKMREKLMRLLSIWEDRRVLQGNQIAELRSSMTQAAGQGGGGGEAAVPDELGIDVNATAPRPKVGGGGASGAGGYSGTSPRTSPLASGTSPRAAMPPPASPAAERVGLAQLLTSLEEGRLVEQIAAEREEGVQLDEIEASEATDPETLERQQMQALGAVEMLRAHQAGLSRELAERQRLILLLAGSCERQHAQCASLTGALEETLALAARAEAAKEQVEARQAEMANIAAMATDAL